MRRGRHFIFSTGGKGNHLDRQGQQSRRPRPPPSEALPHRLPRALSLSSIVQEVPDLIGAAERIRTSDPRITNALLYRLSYRGDSLDTAKYFFSAPLQ